MQCAVLATYFQPETIAVARTERALTVCRVSVCFYDDDGDDDDDDDDEGRVCGLWP